MNRQQRQAPPKTGWPPGQEREAFEAWANHRGVWPMLTHQEIFGAGYKAAIDAALAARGAVPAGWVPEHTDHLGPHLKKQARRLLGQLDASRPRRALDIDDARRLLEAIAAPCNTEKLIADLIRSAWEWGMSCEVDGVRWGEAGDSHNQMWRDRTAEIATRLHAAMLAAAPQQVAQPSVYEQVVQALAGLLEQVEVFVSAHGEADFETAEALRAVEAAVAQAAQRQLNRVPPAVKHGEPAPF